MKKRVLQAIDSEGNILKTVPVGNLIGVEIVKRQAAMQEQFGKEVLVIDQDIEENLPAKEGVLILPVEFKPATKLSNGTHNLKLNTPQLTPRNLVFVDHLCNTSGILMYKATDSVTDKDLEALDSVELDLYDSKKSPSKRLRSVFFLLWEQDNEGFDGSDGFKRYYSHKMEKLISHYKEKLP